MGLKICLFSCCEVLDRENVGAVFTLHREIMAQPALRALASLPPALDFPLLHCFEAGSLYASDYSPHMSTYFWFDFMGFIYIYIYTYIHIYIWF